MQIRNETTLRLNIHKILPVAGSPLLHDLSLNPSQTALLYNEITEQHDELNEMLVSGAVVKLSDAEPSDAQPNADPMATVLLTLADHEMRIVALEHAVFPS